MERRPPNQIRRDLRCYLDLHRLLREIGDAAGAETYLQHVRAMERELELTRTGYVLS